MALKYTNLIMLVIILFIAGFSCFAQEAPLIIWQNEKAIGLSFSKNISDPTLKLSGHHEIIAGRYKNIDGRTMFYSYWPLNRELQYDVWSNNLLICSVTIPGLENVPRPTLDIYPLKDTLPQNLLKFYFKFSEPMSVGNVYGYIKLMDENGNQLQDTFLNLTPELWDLPNRTFTLWVDPGRIKRGLVLNEINGNSFIEGEKYELIISEDWKTARGVPLGKETKKSFFVSQSDRDSPNTKLCKLTLPKRKTMENLVMKFDESLDFILSLECITIEKDNFKVTGQVNVLHNSSSWSITPYRKWESGRYTIIIEPRLEDLAGNNLNRLFDEDLQTKNPKDSKELEVVELEFKL